MKRKLTRYCKEINNVFKTGSELEIREVFNTIYENMLKEFPDTSLYWDRSIYIDSGCNYEMCFENMFKQPDMYKCVLSDDPDEHPGLVIRYKNNENEKW